MNHLLRNQEKEQVKLMPKPTKTKVVAIMLLRIKSRSLYRTILRRGFNPIPLRSRKTQLSLSKEMLILQLILHPSYYVRYPLVKYLHKLFRMVNRFLPINQSMISPSAYKFKKRETQLNHKSWIRSRMVKLHKREGPANLSLKTMNSTRLLSRTTLNRNSF